MRLYTIRGAARVLGVHVQTIKHRMYEQKVLRASYQVTRWGVEKCGAVRTGRPLFTEEDLGLLGDEGERLFRKQEEVEEKGMQWPLLLHPQDHWIAK